VRRARGAPPARAARGQHFLARRALAVGLVGDAAVEDGDVVVDIGAGRGALTAELAARGARVRAVESDPVLAELLRRRFRDDGRVAVVEADARALPPPEDPFAVVANLPFAGATEILRRLLDDPSVPLLRAVVIVQWETAVKWAAVWPSTLLAAYWGAWYELSVLRRLDPEAFAPPPSVAAGVLAIERRDEPLVPEALAPAYRRFLHRGFRDGPRSVVPKGRLVVGARERGFARNPRARDLDAAGWAALFALPSSGRGAKVPPRHAPL
jgi:23S rRNA (adenine-N6)-dimethyltransferase